MPEPVRYTLSGAQRASGVAPAGGSAMVTEEPARPSWALIMVTMPADEAMMMPSATSRKSLLLIPSYSVFGC